jgi:hypothetical protein
MASHSPAQPVGVYQKKYAQFSLRLYSKACESMVGCVHGKPLRDELVPWLPVTGCAGLSAASAIRVAEMSEAAKRGAGMGMKPGPQGTMLSQLALGVTPLAG